MTVVCSHLVVQMMRKLRVFARDLGPEEGGNRILTSLPATFSIQPDASVSPALLLEAIKREQERIVLWAKGFLARRAQAVDEIAAYVAARKRREPNLEVA
jgi:hypothetical protein